MHISWPSSNVSYSLKPSLIPRPRMMSELSEDSVLVSLMMFKLYSSCVCLFVSPNKF